LLTLFPIFQCDYHLFFAYIHAVWNFCSHPFLRYGSITLAAIL
jgi:hypothetical protein